MDEWLDNQTRTILSRYVPPACTTGSSEEAYSLLLLQRASDDARLADAISAVGLDRHSPTGYLPFVVAEGLNLEEAFVGRFALACCDCAAMCVPDQVVQQADHVWWRQFYELAMKSSDFRKVLVEVSEIPATEEGRRFSWQFLGLAVGTALPASFLVFQIKAEMMAHWASRMGAVVDVAPPG